MLKSFSLWDPSSGLKGRERAQWGHRGGCYPLNLLHLRDENDEAKMSQVDDSMQLNKLFRSE